MIRPVIFLGDSLERLREFPVGVRREAGFELRQVQHGLDPSDWKPMKGVGPGVREIRMRAAAGAFRVLYVVESKAAVYVLHAFQKKSRGTARRDLELASLRLRLLR